MRWWERTGTPWASWRGRLTWLASRAQLCGYCLFLPQQSCCSHAWCCQPCKNTPEHELITDIHGSVGLWSVDGVALALQHAPCRFAGRRVLHVARNVLLWPTCRTEAVKCRLCLVTSDDRQMLPRLFPPPCLEELLCSGQALWVTCKSQLSHKTAPYPRCLGGLVCPKKTADSPCT